MVVNGLLFEICNSTLKIKKNEVSLVKNMSQKQHIK